MKKGLVLSTLVCASVLAAELERDCTLGQRYYELSNKAKNEFKKRDAYEFMERAVEVCPGNRYWQELGQLAADFGDAELNKRAAIAYVNAYQFASTEKEQALAIGRYAELLFHSGDPQRALTYIHEARNLDPTTPWITQLSKEISERVSDVRTEDIKRGFESLAFKPLKLQRAGESESHKGIEISSLAMSIGDKRAINIPLNFEINSTRLDSRTRKNIAILAQVLRDDRYADWEFLLVGHADVRGAASHNMLLSVKRANAIYKEIVELQPELQGRIKTMGKGEEEPLSQGNSEEDHRSNRRLEVILRER